MTRKAETEHFLSGNIYRPSFFHSFNLHNVPFPYPPSFKIRMVSWQTRVPLLFNLKCDDGMMLGRMKIDKWMPCQINRQFGIRIDREKYLKQCHIRYSWVRMLIRTGKIETTFTKIFIYSFCLVTSISSTIKDSMNISKLNEFQRSLTCEIKQTK